MERFRIHGGNRLDGTIRISGAKNAALPILMATLLTDEPMYISNVPHLQDVTTTMDMMSQMGTSVTITEKMTLEVANNDIQYYSASYDLVKTMRASILVLGPLLARFGRAHVSLPGGCAIGVRPVNFHMDGLRALGADIRIENGYIEASCEQGLIGDHIFMETSTVTGTENLMMAATLAKGTTILENAACEPEVADLARCLVSMGALIEGIGSRRLVITGVDRLHGASYRILPDRIEIGTYLTAAMMTGGRIHLEDAPSGMLETVLEQLRAAGADIQCSDNSITLDMHGKKPAAINLHTKPFPGIPTDMQAQLTAMNCIAQGTGTITETIFESRFMHVQELQRMGADVRLEGNTVITQGVDQLAGAPLMATDLRSSASLVLAGLVADGETIINRIYHIDRGYETIDEKLKQLGADIQRESVPPPRPAATTS